MDQLIDLDAYFMIKTFCFLTVIMPKSLGGFNGESDGIQRLQDAVMQVSADPRAIFQQLMQPPFSRLERDG
jgi:hypothetical protein